MREKIELKTRRLVLRPLGPEYLQTVHAYASDLENTKYMMHLPNDTIEETLEFLKSAGAEWEKESPSFYEFAVLYEGRQIGAVSIYLEEGAAGETSAPGQDKAAGKNSGAGNAEAPGETDGSGKSGPFGKAALTGELGWVFHRDYWGQGFASEAAGALVEYAVKKLNIRHFIAHCDAENPGSYRVMEKLGMTRTAVSHDRKNRASDEARTEYQYEMYIADAPAEPAAAPKKPYRFSSENSLALLSLHDCACSRLSFRDGQLVCEMDWMEVRAEHPLNPHPEAHQSDAGEIRLIAPRLIEGTLNELALKDRAPVPRQLCSVEELDFRDLEFLRYEERRQNGRFLAKLFLIFDPNDRYDSLSLTLEYERSIVRWNALGAVSWFV